VDKSTAGSISTATFCAAHPNILLLLLLVVVVVVVAAAAAAAAVSTPFQNTNTECIKCAK